MDYLHSDRLQKLTNTFFGKVSDIDRNNVRWERIGQFEDLSDATLHSECTSETEQFHQGFDLGVKYAKALFDANLNGKPSPSIYLVCAPETNHFFMGLEEVLAQHLQSAITMLDHEECVCAPSMLFLHGCNCKAKANSK